MAALGIGALLFAQLAVAAYVCPAADGQSTALPSSIETVAAPCQKMDKNRANLCKQHCEQASQSVDTPVHAAIDVPVLPLIAVITQAANARLPVNETVQGNLLFSNTDPPLSIRNCCFRI